MLKNLKSFFKTNAKNLLILCLSTIILIFCSRYFSFYWYLELAIIFLLGFRFIYLVEKYFYICELKKLKKSEYLVKKHHDESLTLLVKYEEFLLQGSIFFMSGLSAIIYFLIENEKNAKLNHYYLIELFKDNLILQLIVIFYIIFFLTIKTKKSATYYKTEKLEYILVKKLKVK